MGIEKDNGAKCFPSGWSVTAKLCDSCKSAAASLFCRSESVFLCMECDVKLHGTNRLVSWHERVWMCEVCEQAPACVTCKADAAALCVTCDRDIHCANPLAHRHERSPVVPFYHTAESVIKSTAAAILASSNTDSNIITTCQDDTKLPTDTPDMKTIEFLLSNSDHFLDFEYPIPSDPRLHNSRTDNVVPVQITKPLLQPKMKDHSTDNHFEIDFSRSKLNSYNNSYTAQSLSQSVSSSSMDVGVVPDGSSMSDISYPFAVQMNSSTNQASQLSGLEREARVLRYREKRKNRKFQKTIRYASRKAYAETRPRIKGRFAKRIDTEADVDRWFTSGVASGSSAFIEDTRYGVVPSF